MSMQIKSILPYFGGKRTLAPTIVEELGEHTAYWEPYCGSLAVLLAKPRSTIESVNDLYGDAVNLAMVLASDRWRELYERAGRQLLCEELVRAYRADLARGDFERVPADPRDVGELHVERACRFLAVAWIGRNGEAGTQCRNHSYAVRWTQSGGSPSVRWNAALESVPAWHERLRNVAILHRRASEVLGSIADEDRSVIYADPPYFKASRADGGGSRYLHDFDDVDHEELAASLGRFRRVRVVLSYYDHPRLKELYPGWTRRTLLANKNLNQTRRGRSKVQAPEVLLINGPSLVEGVGGMLF